MPDNQFDHQNKIDFEPVVSEPKKEKKETENFDDVAEMPLMPNQAETRSLEQKEVADSEIKEKKAIAKADISGQIDDYCLKRNFLPEQKNTLVKAISLIIKDHDSGYTEAEKLVIETGNDALLDAFHDLIINNPVIRDIIENK